MKRTLLILLWMVVCIPLGAQITHRDSVLTQARYLKSIYRTDDAIDMLSTLVQPGAMDDAVLSELADLVLSEWGLREYFRHLFPALFACAGQYPL